MLRRGFWISCFGILATCLALVTLTAEAAPSKDRWAIFAFAGRMTKGTWQTIVFHPDRIVWAPTGLLGVGVSYELLRTSYGLGLEIEANAVQYTHKQQHQELNVPIVLRWHRFPWDRHADTSAAIGVGLSYATEIPVVEANISHGMSRQVLAYWMFELEAGVPDTGWSVFGRIHHRSPAFGLFGNNGGSNSLVLGGRKRF